MSGFYVPGWFVWLLTYWNVVLLVVVTLGGYGVWMLVKRWRNRL